MNGHAHRAATKLIARHIEMDPDRPGPDEARLSDSGVRVWAIIGQFNAIGGNVQRVATDYRLELPAVEAALAYYRQNKAAIDARIAANAPSPA